MRRVVACSIAVVALAGCGNTKTQSRTAAVGQGKGPTTGPYLFDIPGTVKTLSAEGIDAKQTTGSSDHIAAHALPAPSQSETFEAGGTPFTLLLFPSEDLANDASPSLKKNDGEVVIGKNIIAVIKPRGADYDRLRQAIANLGDNPPGPEPSFPAKGEPNS